MWKRNAKFVVNHLYVNELIEKLEKRAVENAKLFATIEFIGEKNIGDGRVEGEKDIADIWNS